MRSFFTLVVLVGCFAALAEDDGSKAKSKLPDEIRCLGKIYKRLKGRERFGILAEGDVNGDGKKEIVVRYRLDDGTLEKNITAIFKPSPKNGPARFAERNLLTLIIRYGTPLDAEFFDIDDDGAREMILWDRTGNHYTNLAIFTYKKNEFKRIFKNGTACYLCRIDYKKKPLRITIGRENWDYKYFCYMNSDKTSLKEVWEWNGEKFEFKKDLSTTVPISEEEASDRFVEKIKEYMKK